MKFDPTISLGSLIAALSIIVTLLLTWGRFLQRFGALEAKVEMLMDWWSSYIERRSPISRP